MEAAENLVCAITLELPFDPVTAEDGRIYERRAVEEHIAYARENQQPLLSPVTRQPMGPRLFPSPQIKSTIESLIADGTVKGNLAVAWKEKEEEKKRADSLLQQAQAGDPHAMYYVFCGYYDGRNGFKRDYKEAYRWMERAHAAGSVLATVFLGVILLDGRCGDFIVPKDERRAMDLFESAARDGSDMAACLLGGVLASGKCGCTVNTEAAINWFLKGLSRSCPHQHLADSERQEARKMLEELVARFLREN